MHGNVLKAPPPMADRPSNRTSGGTASAGETDTGPSDPLPDLSPDIQVLRLADRNALKDGFYTAAERARRRAMNAFIADMNAAVARLEREPVPLTQNRPPPNLSSRIHAGTQSLGSLSRRATGSRHGGRDHGRWLYETAAGGQGQGEGG